MRAFLPIIFWLGNSFAAIGSYPIRPRLLKTIPSTTPSRISVHSTALLLICSETLLSSENTTTEIESYLDVISIWLTPRSSS